LIQPHKKTNINGTESLEDDKRKTEGTSTAMESLPFALGAALGAHLGCCALGAGSRLCSPLHGVLWSSSEPMLDMRFWVRAAQSCLRRQQRLCLWNWIPCRRRHLRIDSHHQPRHMPTWNLWGYHRLNDIMRALWPQGLLPSSRCELLYRRLCCRLLLHRFLSFPEAACCSGSWLNSDGSLLCNWIR